MNWSSRAGIPAVLAFVVVVSGSCSMATRGTMPPPGPDGIVDANRAPDFIAFVGQTDHIIGWVPKEFLLGDPTGDPNAPIPVYADDLRTLIGHDVAGKGFVPLGVDPAGVPKEPVVVAPSAAP